MTELDEQDIEDMRNADRIEALHRERQLRGECWVCGERDCAGCADEDENASVSISGDEPEYAPRTCSRHPERGACDKRALCKHGPWCHAPGPCDLFIANA